MVGKWAAESVNLDPLEVKTADAGDETYRIGMTKLSLLLASKENERTFGNVYKTA